MPTQEPAPASIVDDDRLREAAIRRPVWWSAEATFVVAIVLIGVLAGLGGMLLALLLHAIQHIAYGYSLDAVVSPESFLQGVTAAPPIRRLIALTLCGAAAGVGWWAIYRYGQKLISIKAAVGTDKPGPRMPIFTTAAHVVLQMTTVALGSPLGREVAPREMGALLATQVASRVGLSADDTRIAIACAAGAGLAAVYNVPIGGAVFVLEVLLGTWAPRTVVAAVTTSVIGSTVAWIGLGNVPTYLVPPMEISWPLVIMAIVTGPVFGLAAYGFKTLTQHAIANTSHGWKMIPWSLVVFVLIGLTAMLFPQLPGNGKGPSQLGFDGDLGVRLAASLLVLKVVAVAAALRVGAAGGVLTPGLAVGALTGTLLCHLLTPLLPGAAPAGLAIVGGAAFLASSMNMPLTAIFLALEFTRVNHDFCVPIFLAVAGSMTAMRACTGLGPMTRWPFRRSADAAEHTPPS